MADTFVLLDADVEDASSEDELVVDGERLALGEGTCYEREAYFVSGGIVCSWPYDLVDVQLLWI